MEQGISCSLTLTHSRSPWLTGLRTLPLLRGYVVTLSSGKSVPRPCPVRDVTARVCLARVSVQLPSAHLQPLPLPPLPPRRGLLDSVCPGSASPRPTSAPPPLTASSISTFSLGHRVRIKCATPCGAAQGT